MKSNIKYLIIVFLGIIILTFIGMMKYSLFITKASPKSSLIKDINKIELTEKDKHVKSISKGEYISNLCNIKNIKLDEGEKINEKENKDIEKIKGNYNIDYIKIYCVFNSSKSADYKLQVEVGGYGKVKAYPSGKKEFIGIQATYSKSIGEDYYVWDEFTSTGGANDNNEVFIMARGNIETNLSEPISSDFLSSSVDTVKMHYRKTLNLRFSYNL